MAVGNFKQIVWASKIQTQLDTITSLKDHCDFEYEGEIKYAERVKILGVVRPTVKTYVPGTPLERESGKDNSQFMDIDQSKYYDFDVDDVEKVQSKPGKIEKLTEEGNKALSEAADKYVASLVAKEKANLASAVSTDISTVTDGGISLIEGGFKKLYENDCKVSDNYHLEINPEWYTILRPEIIELDTNNSDLIKKGYVGKYGNALISIENLLSKWNDGTNDCTLCMLRTTKAIAFAGQLEKVEAFRPHDGFCDAVKALYVFGAKIVRPEQIYLFPIY